MTEVFTYKYYLLAKTTPFRSVHDSEGMLRGTEVPDSSQRSGYRVALGYMDRLARSDEIEEVTEQKFQQFLTEEENKKKAENDLRL